MNCIEPICVSLSHKTVDSCLKAIRTFPMVEVRLDLMDVRLDEIPLLFEEKCSIVATCRTGTHSKEDRLKLLQSCIVSGADYVDIEIESDADFRVSLTKLAKKKGCKVILSYHNFEETPSVQFLIETINSSFALEADIVKVACQVNSQDDNAIVLSLYEKFTNIIAIGMGEKGRITRLAAPFLGAPFTYASDSNQSQTAPGQMDHLTLQSLMENFTYSTGGVEIMPGNDLV